MLETCLKCWRKRNGIKDIAHKYVMSKELELCKSCGNPKHLIVGEYPYYWKRKFRFVLLPFKIIFNTIYIIYRLIELPFRIIIYWDDFEIFIKNSFKE